MSLPQVSVVVPVFNAERHLRSTLESVLAQTEPALELLVVDDCSHDATADIVRALAHQDSRVRYLRMGTNSGGPARPRNLGVMNARAEWIALCDSDDLWHPAKLERQLAFVARERADLACTAIRDFDDDGAVPRFDAVPAALSRAEPISLRRMLMKNCIATSSVLVRREAVLATGGFDPDRTLVAVEDYDLWLRLLEHRQRLARLPEPLVHYRRAASSLSARKLQMVRKVLRVLSRHFERAGHYWLFPIAAPVLMATYATHSIVLRVWRGRV